MANTYMSTPNQSGMAPQNNYAVEASRAMEEIKGKMFLAKQFPRDTAAAMNRILSECKRVSLAEQAEYEFPRGETKVTGPSIRFAEMVARHWGNLIYGTTELEQKNGESIAKAFAWDLETNSSQEITFTVKHSRDTKRGPIALKDSRDIYEMVANQGARRRRACILALIPGDVIDEALEACRETLKGNVSNGKSAEEVRAELLAAFQEYGITQEQLEAKIGYKLEAFTPNNIVSLRRLYIAIRDGMVTPAAAFGLETADQTPSEEETSALDELNAKLAKGKGKAAEAEPETGEKLPWEN